MSSARLHGQQRMKWPVIGGESEALSISVGGSTDRGKMGSCVRGGNICSETLRAHSYGKGEATSVPKRGSNSDKTVQNQ